LSNPAELGTRYTHLHALTASLWFVLLITQPILVLTKRLDLHRTIGGSAWVLGPVVLVGIVLGAHAKLGTWPAELQDLAAFILYLQVSLGILFGVFWSQGLRYRKDMAVHSRFMVATAFTFVDPVFARLLPATDITPLITFGLANALILTLIWLERDARRGRWVFPLALGLFVLIELPMLLGFPASDSWASFATWFGGLPLT